MENKIQSNPGEIMNNTKTFEYTYSSSKQEEIDRIRKKYMPKTEDKMELLRRMDRSVTLPGTVWSLVLGIIGCLIFGTGMCCVLVWDMILPGVVIGIVGMLIMCMAYPVYSSLTNSRKVKMSAQIIALADEISNNE